MSHNQTVTTCIQAYQYLLFSHRLTVLFCIGQALLIINLVVCMASVDFDSIISLRFRLPKFNMPAARTLRGEGTKKANKSNFIFAPCRRIPWSQIMKFSTLMLLDGLHLYLNFGKIRFINNGFITKKEFQPKKPRKVFLAPSAKLGIGSNNNCLWQKLY